MEDLLFKWEDEDTEDTQHRGSSLSIIFFFLAIRQHTSVITKKKLEEEARVAPVQGWRTPGRVIWFSCLQLFQDNPIGDWDGVFDGKLLCNFASLEHTRLVPICDVMPGESPSYLCFSRKKKYPAVPVLDQFWAPYEGSCLCFACSGNREPFVYMAHLFLKVKWDTRALCSPHWHIDLFMCAYCCFSDYSVLHRGNLEDWDP